MQIQEIFREDAVEMAPELKNLVTQAEETGKKMAASRSLKYQLYIPRNTKVVKESVKPQAKLWTSTAVYRGGNSYTSAWAEWCHINMRQWLAPKGQLYQVQPGARVLNIGSDAAARKIAKIFDMEFASGNYGKILSNYPWEKLGQLVDGIRYPARLRGTWGSGLNNILMSMWDVESTAWFRTDKLNFVKEVDINVRGW